MVFAEVCGDAQPTRATSRVNRIRNARRLLLDLGNIQLHLLLLHFDEIAGFLPQVTTRRWLPAGGHDHITLTFKAVRVT